LFRILVAVLSTLLLSGPARAQIDEQGHWNQDYDPHVAALGLAVGYTSGTGLALRWPAFPQTMMSLAGGAWGQSDELDWNLGAEAHYVLRQSGRTRVFLGPGIGAYSDHDADDTNVNVSLNVGFERLLQPRLSVKADIGFTYLGDDGAVYPLPQIAVYYYF
jgi:hypothetical protein